MDATEVLGQFAEAGLLPPARPGHVPSRGLILLGLAIGEQLAAEGFTALTICRGGGHQRYESGSELSPPTSVVAGAGALLVLVEGRA